MEQLLTTKLFIPPTRPEIVSRPRLVDRMNMGLHCKLTLISAPAGFGKTTLVNEWIGAITGTVPPIAVAWLSLDEGDNDLVRFLTYFIAAFKQIKDLEANFGKGTQGMLQSSQPPPAEEILTPLINEIAIIPDKIILVLDDYHLIDAQSVHDALNFFLENIPPQVHLVIATREDPPLPLSRLRARCHLTEIRASDLRFTSAEAAEFLNQVMGLNLSTQAIAALETRTEGWIAGLQLAGISMQGKEDTTELIKSFTGSHRLVLDFLIEEVLDQQPQNVQDFLLHTAILDRMTGSLCDALTGQVDGQQTLEYLDQANLFIIPLDEERRWYRYHHLFADLLRRRLNQIQPEQVPVLHHRTSEWFQANGFPDQAIVHALRAEDFELAAVLINEQADALWERGDHGNLRAWLEVLPDEFILSRPLLTIYRAYYLHSSGKREEGDYFLNEAEKYIKTNIKFSNETSNNYPEEEEKNLLGRFELIRALIFTFTGDVPGMIVHSNQALEYLPEQDMTLRSLAAFTLGDAYSYVGDMSVSYQARAEALRACEAAGNVYYSVVAGLKLASTLKEQGELHQAVELCQRYMQQANDYGFSKAGPVGCLMALLGDVLAELNELEKAILLAKEGVQITERSGNLTILGYSYFYLMRVLFSQGDLIGVQEIIQKVAQLDLETTVPSWLTNQTSNWQVRIWLEKGLPEAASEWVANHSLDPTKIPEDIDYLTLFDYIMFARILIAQNKLDEAEGLLQRVVGRAEESGRKTSVIEFLILKALAYQAGGNINQAMIPLERALKLAEPLGYFRIFLDEGPPMARLLYETSTRGIARDYVRRLLAAFPDTDQEQIERENPRITQTDLVEALSDREIEVLQLIGEGLTNPEIASRLYLSLNTVKVHTRNIYGKLGVSSRMQAVARAIALGILPST